MGSINTRETTVPAWSPGYYLDHVVKCKMQLHFALLGHWRRLREIEILKKKELTHFQVGYQNT